MEEVSWWFDGNRHHIEKAIDKAVRKVDKEYQKNERNKRNEIMHERLVRLVAFPDYLEVQTLEMPSRNSWVNREAEFAYSFDARAEDNRQALYGVFEALAEYYGCAGFEPEVEYDVYYDSPKLTLFW